MKDQIGKKVEWTKQNAVNTKRKQDYLDREAKKAAKSMEFLSQPTDDTFPAEVSQFSLNVFDLRLSRVIISGRTAALIQAAFLVRI